MHRPGVERVARGAASQPITPSSARAGAVLVDPRVLEQLVEVHVEDAGGVVGPLDVAADPEQRLGDAGSASAVPPQMLLLLLLLLLAASVSSGPGSGAGESRGQRRRPAASSRPAPGRLGARRRRLSTQVSLEPPPWLELTTRLALGQRDAGQAAGQHAHVVAVVDRERAQVDVPGREPVVDLRRHRRQLHDRLRDPAARVVADRLARRLQLACARAAARSGCPCRRSPSTGLSTSSSSVVEHLRARSSVDRPAAERVDVGQDRLLAEVVADQVGHVGVDAACRRPTPLPTALAIATLPGPGRVDHARRTPSTESGRKCTGSRNSSSIRR